MRKPGWLLSPSFCLDAISLSFNIFIHSLLFSFISQLILFIICPYLQAWQSILHSASADRWKNDPCLTLPSITSLLPSLLSSWSPSETRLTGCYISSSHSNPPPPPTPSSHPHDRAFSLQCALFTSLAARLWVATIGDETKERGHFPKPLKTVKSRNTLRHSGPIGPSLSLQISLVLSGCIFLQTPYIHTLTYFAIYSFPSTPTPTQPYHMATPCWHGTPCISRTAGDYCAPTAHGGGLGVQSRDIKAHSRWRHHSAFHLYKTCMNYLKNRSKQSRSNQGCTSVEVA